jgi:hypothetical protein
MLPADGAGFTARLAAAPRVGIALINPWRPRWWLPGVKLATGARHASPGMWCRARRAVPRAGASPPRRGPSWPRLDGRRPAASSASEICVRWPARGSTLARANRGVVDEALLDQARGLSLGAGSAPAISDPPTPAGGEP